MPARIKLNEGDRFGNLTYICDIPSIRQPNGKLRRYVKCACDCGNTQDIALTSIREGKTRSCGCQKGHHKHGLTNHRLFSTRQGIMYRCYNKKSSFYNNYGGRGIRVNDNWHDPHEFVKDMDNTFKEGLTIERIDNNGNYCKSNCKRIPLVEQSYNRRTTVLYKGECITKVLRDKGICSSTYYRRLSRGMSIEESLRG